MMPYKNFKLYGYILLSGMLFSCATSVQFPVSSVLPTAEVEAKIKKDDNENYLIDLTAEHLANPERLDPARDLYLVWLRTKKDEYQNLGRLTGNPDKKSQLRTVTPLKPERIIITAENKADLRKPGKQVIFRSEKLRL